MFKKSINTAKYLKCAIYGISGSGKTYTSLKIAQGLKSKPDSIICLIDSEHGSASKYSDRFDFYSAEPTNYSIEEYLKTIEEAEKFGAEVLIIDSLSHSWEKLCEEVDKIANARYKGNSWSAWSEGTPLQRKLVQAIIRFKGHVICTMRSATEWQTNSGDNGKIRPIRIGLKPIQGKNIEYEFDILIEMNADNTAQIVKDRSGKFQSKIIEKPDEKFGEEIRTWINSLYVQAPPIPLAQPVPVSDPVPVAVFPDNSNNQSIDQFLPDNTEKHDRKISEPQRKRLFAIGNAHKRTAEQIKSLLNRYGYEHSADILVKDYDPIINEIEGKEAL